MIRASVRICASAAAVVVLAGAATAAAAVRAGSGTALRVASLSTAGDPDLVVVVPPTVAAQAIPSAAFRVRQDGALRRISVNHLTDEGLDVHIVLDTSVTNTFLAVEQAAASDLLRALPRQVRTATQTSGGLLHAPQSGSAAALAVLAQVRADPAVTQFETSTTLASVAASPTEGRRRIIVLLTACSPDTAHGFPSLPGLLAPGSQQLDVVSPGRSCGSALAAQARSSGGIGVTGTPSARIPEAVDTVTYDILGQYHLTVADAGATSPLVIALDYGGVHATTTVPLAAPPAAVTPAGSQSTVFKTLAALAGLILILTAAGYVAAFRHRSPLLPA